VQRCLENAVTEIACCIYSEKPTKSAELTNSNRGSSENLCWTEFSGHLVLPDFWSSLIILFFFVVVLRWSLCSLHVMLSVFVIFFVYAYVFVFYTFAYGPSRLD